jgi:DNA-binding NarL/FixJ family response regulator
MAGVSDVVRVLLVDDDPLVRSGLKMMLGGAEGIDVVGEVGDGRGVLAAVDSHHPDVVLMDIRMPQLDGIAATRLLRGQPSGPARQASCSRTRRRPSSSAPSRRFTRATACSPPP